MIRVFRAAPEEMCKLHFSPLCTLSTPFLMHSSNPSESYHAALPCSLNKSFFFHPIRCLRLVPHFCSSSSPRLLLFLPYLRCCLCPMPLALLSTASNSPICNYLIQRYSISFFNAFLSSARLLHASISALPHFDFVLTLLLLFDWPECMDFRGKT